MIVASNSDLQQYFNTIVGSEWVTYSFQVEQNIYTGHDCVYLDLKIRDLKEFPANMKNLDRFLSEFKCLKLTSKNWHSNGSGQDRVYQYSILMSRDFNLGESLSKFAQKIADEEFTKTFEEALKQS